MTSIDAGTAVPQHNSPKSMTSDHWLRYADNLALNGWNPIPTGRVENGKTEPSYKIPWLSGLTGQSADFAAADSYPAWLDRVQSMRASGVAGVLSIGVRCNPNQIGIDVDAYGSKPGLESLADLEHKLGPLPPAPVVTARRYDSGSGIRLFHIRDGWMGKPNPAAGIELVQWWHRHIQAPPSWHHTGRTVRCYGVKGRQIRSGLLPEDLPTLPDSWHEALAYEPSQGVGVETLTDTEFAERYNDGPQPDAIDGLIRSKLGDDCSETHTPMLILLSKAAQEARGGRYPWAGARDKIREAAERSYKRRSKTLSGQDFCRAVEWGIGSAMAISEQDCYDAWQRKNEQGPRTSIFTVMGPSEWAKPVPEIRFLIKQALVEDTYGVNAGPKKSLKTHDNASMALALGTGKNLYLDSRFEVARSSRVLYVVGEGGQNQVRRLLHRMCTAYGVKPQDVANDPSFPLQVAFGAAPLDSPKLREELKALLDAHQPDAVFMESYYNFAPSGLQGGDVYSRGPVIDDYHKFIRAGNSGTVSLLTDHYRKGTNSLDLDAISMSGQGENSDSWIMRAHREEPDVPNGEFRLTTMFSSRVWGGCVFDIDWHVGPFSHDLGYHVGEIGWAVKEHSGLAQVQSANTKPKLTDDAVEAAIFAYMNLNGASTKSEIHDGVNKDYKIPVHRIRDKWANLVANQDIYEHEGKTTGKDGKQRKRMVWEVKNGL